MRAPLSWLREYVDLPADVTLSLLTDKLTMLGLKLEAVTNPSDAITGPLVLGRVLTLEKEPQKNGNTINWCTVDVSTVRFEGSNGTGDPVGSGPPARAAAQVASVAAFWRANWSSVGTSSPSVV